jgi:teichuronic acid biosynthesis glycosyltransferase TuaC
VKVLWLTNMWPDEQRPWYGSFVYSQAMSISKLGVDLELLYIPGYQSAARYASGAAEIVRRSLRADWDVVHAHFGHSGVIGRLQLRAPLVLSYCGDDLLGTPGDDGVPTAKSLAIARAFAQLSRFSAATITKSEEMERRLPARCRARNYVVPNGVDLDFWRPVPRLQARADLDWPQQKKVVLFVGNPKEPRKNFTLAEEVVRSINQRGIPVDLRVAWAVEPSALPLWMSASDVLLFPSFAEGSPNVVKEAMAMELPVVAAPVGDVPERLDGVTGGFVVERTVDAMAGAVEAALVDQRSSALREAVAKLEVSVIAGRVVEIYEQVLSRPGDRQRR